MSLSKELESIKASLIEHLAKLERHGISALISGLHKTGDEKDEHVLPPVLIPLETAIQAIDENLRKADTAAPNVKSPDRHLIKAKEDAKQAREKANKLLIDYKELLQDKIIVPQTSDTQVLREQIASLQAELSIIKEELTKKISTIQSLTVHEQPIEAVKSEHAPLVDAFIESLGQLVSLEYDKRAYPIESLVTQFIHQIKIARREQLLTKEDATMHLNNTFQLLSKAMTPENYRALANNLPGHPNKTLKKLGETMMLLGTAVLAALGTAIGLGITIPSASIVVPAALAAASLSLLAGGLGVFSGRSKGLQQIASNVAYQIDKVAVDSIITPFNS